MAGAGGGQRDVEREGVPRGEHQRQYHPRRHSCAAWYTESFGGAFSAAPQLIGGVATYDDGDGAYLRYRSLESGSVQLKIEEDKTQDSETNHATEVVGYLAIEGSGTLTAQGQAAPAEVRKTYSFGGQRVAVRVNGTLSYLYSDHLGSASLTTDADGNVTAEMRYYPYGETRWSTGTMATDRRYTGQREEAGLELYDYVARRYDPRLGRFLQADTIVPDPHDPQAMARYAYVRSNPLKFRDPTGHWWEDDTSGALLLRPPVQWVYGTSRELGMMAQKQRPGSNDCGATALAMSMSIRLRQEGYQGNVSAPSLAGTMQGMSGLLGIHHYRLTATANVMFHWFDPTAGDIEGATPPWGMTRAYDTVNRSFVKAGLPDVGTAEYAVNATKQDLIANIEQGRPTSIQLNWSDNDGGGAHWVNVVGYSETSDAFYLLDPEIPWLSTPETNVRAISWTLLNVDWSRTLNLPFGYSLQNVIVTYGPGTPQ